MSYTCEKKTYEQHVDIFAGNNLRILQSIADYQNQGDKYYCNKESTRDDTDKMEENCNNTLTTISIMKTSCNKISGTERVGAVAIWVADMFAIWIFTVTTSLNFIVNVNNTKDNNSIIQLLCVLRNDYHIFCRVFLQYLLM